MSTQIDPELGLCKISELIKDGSWNDKLVTKVFVEEDREMIMKISLSLRETKDRLFLVHSAFGEYTVKSGYRSVGGSNEESGSRSEVNAKE